jgi:hypothetical protein
MPTPDQKDWEDLTDFQKANLKPSERDRYLEIRKEEFLEMAEETMNEEIAEAQRIVEKKKSKSS